MTDESVIGSIEVLYELMLQTVHAVNQGWLESLRHWKQMPGRLPTDSFEKIGEIIRDLRHTEQPYDSPSRMPTRHPQVLHKSHESLTSPTKALRP